MSERNDSERIRIGEAAARTGVGIQTLRYYERRKLLPEPARSASGQRLYPVGTLRVVRFIKRAQELGFRLEEIRELLQLRAGTRGSRNRARTIAQEKLSDIGEKLRRLRSMEKALTGLVRTCRSGSGRPTCPILEALEEPHEQEGRRG